MTINIFNIKYNIKKEHMIIVSIFLAMVISLISYFGIKNHDEIIIDTEYEQERQETEQETQESLKEKGEKTFEETREISKISEIKVYVIGCVNNPGIITLSKGQLLYEAIEAAGGLTEDADLENINMVYPLEENVMIKILAKDTINNDKEDNDDKENNKVNYSDYAGSSVEIKRNMGNGVIDTKNNNSSNSEEITGGNSSIYSKGLVNINKANIDELTTLPGIGTATANDIIEYREKNGLFKSIEDVMNVTGIKEKRFEKIKDLIIVE